MISRRGRLGIGALLCASVVATTTSCSLGPDDLPSARGGVGDSFTLTLDFSSVLNLPEGADVILNGIRVGEVENLEVTGQNVVVTAQIAKNTQISSDVRAIIRQNTLLGDPYVALVEDPTKPKSSTLLPGEVIPIERTTAPPTLEDTIAVLAYFVNGGTIQHVENAIGKLNDVMPALNDVQRMANVVAVDLHDLGDKTSEIDRMLTGLSSTAATVDANGPTLAMMFQGDESHTGTYYWREWCKNIVYYVALVLPSIGSIFEGGLWLVPLLDSLADTASTGRAMWDDGPAASQKLAELLRTNLLPFAQNPSVNITSVETSGGEQVTGDVQNVLRMLGAVR